MQLVELINKQNPVQYINLSRALSFERQKLMSRDIFFKQFTKVKQKRYQPTTNTSLHACPKSPDCC